MSNGTQQAVKFTSIYNRTEKRLKKELTQLIKDNDSRIEDFTEKDLLDVLAIACTALPAKYVHKGTIVIGDSIKNEDIANVLNDAINFVKSNPKV